MSLRKRSVSSVAFDFARSKQGFSGIYILLAALLASPTIYAAPASATTATTLALSASQVAQGTAVTLTAAVAASAPVKIGQVNFCDAAATYCTDIHLLGTAQLTSAGSAVLTFVPGIGTHNYKAVFTGTNNTAASTSSETVLDVTGDFATAATITSSGDAGNYTLTASVAGSASTVPSGTVSFVDTSNANQVLGTAPLGVGATTLNLLNSWKSNGDDAYSVTAADFNGDGHLDLAVTNIHQSSLTVLLGNGDGTFKTAPSASSGAFPTFLTTGDFNGDGKPDLAVVSVNENTVTVLLGKGDGTFIAGPVLATGSLPQGVSIGDFNNDGNADLAVPNYSGETVTVWLGNGDGTFTAARDVQDSGGPVGLALADLNGDGKMDMVVANWDSGNLTVLLGNGDGTFTPMTVEPQSGTNPSSIASGDFNGDGKADLAVSNYGDNTATVLLGNGDGTFTAAPKLTPGNAPASVALADFNGDGKADLTVLNSGNSTVAVLLGNGDGTFAAPTATPNGGYPQEVIAGDFNGDGLADVAVANDANDANGQAVVFLTHLAQTATAKVSGVSPAGTGTHLINVSYPGDSIYAASVSSTTPLTAEPSATLLSLSVPPTAIYGNPVLVKALVTDSATQVSVTGGTVTFADQTGGFGMQEVSGGIANQSYLPPSLGTFTINANFTPPNNTMNKASGQATIQITAALLTLQANDASRTYGTANPQFTGTMPGALSDDQLVETFSTQAIAGSPVGSYPIVPSISGTAAANYSPVVKNGTLTVNPAALMVSADNLTRIYGTPNPTFTGKVTGNVNGDTFTEAFTTTATQSSPVSTYPIIPSPVGAALSNYKPTITNGMLTITQATLSISADSKTRAYGAVDPPFTGTMTGALPTDAVQETFSADATQSSAPGTYSVTPSATGQAIGNYVVSAAKGVLTITAAPLSASVVDVTRVYGASNPSFTGNVTGASNGDSFTETFTTDATPQSSAGTYTVTPVIQGTNLGSYTPVYHPGHLTVLPAPLAATAASAARPYGAPNPALAGTLSGVVNGDAITVVYTTAAGVTDAPGQYPVIATVTGSNIANYAITAGPGVLTVTKAGTTITLSRPTNTAANDGSIQLQAQVQPSTSGVPGGSVRFFNGKAMLGEAILQGGIASFATSQVQENSANQVMAVYQGDTNFLPSSSDALPVAPVTTDFWVAPSVGMQSITTQVGTKAVFALQANPGNGGVYPGLVTFSVTGLPAGATAVFSPATLAQNSGAQTVTLTVQTAAGSATAPVSVSKRDLGEDMGKAALALVLLPLAASRRLRKTGRGLTLLLLVAIGSLAGAGFLTGCGFASGAAWNSKNAGPVTYDLTVTMTSGSIAHTTKVSLTTQQ